MLPLDRSYSACAQLYNKAPGLRYGDCHLEGPIKLLHDKPGADKDTAVCRACIF